MVCYSYFVIETCGSCVSPLTYSELSSKYLMTKSMIFIVVTIIIA